MPKYKYLIISGLISFRFFSNRLFPFFTDDILLVLMLLWTVYGFFYYKTPSSLYTRKNQGIALFFLFLFFLSSLSPVFIYNQSFIGTFIAMRGNFVVLFLFTLFKIGPSEEDIFKCFRFLAIIAIFMGIMALIFPSLFVNADKLSNLSFRQQHGSTDIGVIWPGSSTVVFFFYMQIQRMIQRETIEDFIFCTILMAYIFLMQNRSTMLLSVPAYFYALNRSKIRYKKIIIIVLFVLIGSFSLMVISELIRETTEQINDANYNRWQAVDFFIIEHTGNLYTFLFGNGIPCSGSAYLSYLQCAQNTRNAIASDIGMLGSFYFYGIVTIIFIYYFILKGLNKGNPLYLSLLIARPERRIFWITATPQ